MISFLVAIAKSYSISATGFAIANTIGSFAIDNNISGETTFPLDKPIKTSAFCMASSSECKSRAVANSSF